MEDKTAALIDAFKSTMAKCDLPSDYPAQALAAFAVDLRAAAAFVKTKEGAMALGLCRVGDSTPFSGENTWASLPLEQQLAIAKTIAHYVTAHEPASSPRKNPTVQLIENHLKNRR
jgi:hypothetical protein